MQERFIPLSVPNIKGNEIKYVTQALESEWVSTGGSMIDSFEESISTFVHSAGAVACQSGTAGLHLALNHFNISSEEAVIVPTLTFIAAVNPVKYLHAEPIFIDCDESLCIDPVKLKSFLETECYFDGKKTVHKLSKRKIGAIIIVHVFGNMADMENIMDVASEYNLPVIEDATEALGTYYTKGRYSGKYAGTIGDIGIYSFNGNKIITTGGGGMIVSDNLEVLKSLKYFSTQAKDDSVRFIHNSIGYNYRMTNVQAAIGIAQLECLNNFIKTKKLNYESYKQQLQMITGVRILDFRDGTEPNYWFYSLLLEDTRVSKDILIKKLQAYGIQTRPIWGLISDQKPYEGSLCTNLNSAKYYHDRIINLPCSTNLKTEDRDYVIDILKYLLCN